MDKAADKGKGGNRNKRRWGGGGKGEGDDAPRDLSSKMASREGGAFDSDDDAPKARPRNARREQRLGVRSFKPTGKGPSTDELDNDEQSAVLPTPRGWTQPNRLKTPRPPTDAGASKASSFTLSSAPRGRTNPYASKPAKTPAPKSAASVPSTAKTSRSKRATHHVVCAVSENLARETCVASMDAGRPTYLQVTKQGNGQTYAETLSLLRMLNPDEVLLNEGRRNSQLATKVAALFGHESEGMEAVVAFGGRKNAKKGNNNGGNNAKGRKRFGHRGGRGEARDDLTSADPSSGAPETSTVVKFVPRAYFDQTKGAELLRKLARNDTYDASLVEEYILLSSSHAVLQYAQLCLGAGLTRGSLALDVNVGGNHRMNLDRATMANLELLTNARTGRTANSLVGTIDCTKTSVGGRLLRTNLMAPPTRLDTINARLDLVDSLLEDEEFFYAVMEHLEGLPDVDKMLSHVALAPRKRFDNSGNGALFGNAERGSVTARMASKGISALVCIKSTLSVIPSFAHVLQVQLKELDERDMQSSRSGATSAAQQRRRSNSDSRDEDESTTVVESETSRHEDGSNTVDLTGEGTDDTMMGDRTPASDRSSLQIGLGTNSRKSNGGARMSPNKRTRHQLLRAILIAMRQPALSRVLDAVSNIFTESTSYSKSSHAMRHQECFALRPETDGMMDVLRKAFLANVDDIYRLADEYSESYDITVQVRETASRGYYLSVSADLGLDLPEVFIQPVKNGRYIHCTTEEVYSLNSRAQENVQDLLLMTHSRIQEVLQVARDNYDCIASLSDAIALLDLCHCFADNVASSRLPWCRPVLSDRGTDPDQEAGGGGAMAIRNGRYAIDVGSTGAGSSVNGGDFVPNDTYSSSLQNFTVITGINGSGKSTYLKQIALIVILAHCGSYVPADEALLPIRDQICTRIGTADDQEHNISTFLLEMKETAFICNSTTDRSLFLLDELGRATSNEDGVAVAWAVSEHLLTKRALTFFVTHYPQISKLAEVYPNVQNQHLGSQISSGTGSGSGSISYTHKILPGPCRSAGDYGVEMASTCGWPDDAVRNARRIRAEVKRNMPGEEVCSADPRGESQNFAESRRKAHNVLCDVAKHLAAMKEGEGRLSKEAKRNYLEELRERLIPSSSGDESLVRMIRNLLLNVEEQSSVPLPFAPRPVAAREDCSSARKDDSAVAAEEDRVPSQAEEGLKRAKEDVEMKGAPLEAAAAAPGMAGFQLQDCSSSSSSSGSDSSDEDDDGNEEETAPELQNNARKASDTIAPNVLEEKLPGESTKPDATGKEVARPQEAKMTLPLGAGAQPVVRKPSEDTPSSSSSSSDSSSGSDDSSDDSSTSSSGSSDSSSSTTSKSSMSTS
ncbi:hypothetical protein ACHAXT_000875 [Thalassiosira profunda]